MKKIILEDLLEIVRSYNVEGIDVIQKAYDLASNLHSGQYRESGELYVSHPLNVAFTLAEMNADSDTICAALLHDTLEDTDITKEEIETLFNKEVTKLVSGVTKLARMNFSSKEEQNYANTRKIITSIAEDVRIIIIKLADRLHNMQTLEFKKAFKQKENALETMEIFVPLAYYIGAYRIKNELEDISLRYLEPDKYKQVEEIKLKLEDESYNCLHEMLFKIQNILASKDIPTEIKVRTKNIYGIYKRISEGHKLSDIHDLHALKIMVDEVDNCYRTLGYIHKEYHPINDKFKDYICNPKTNMYSSLYSTVFGPEDRLVQIQIRTFDMDKVASFGLPAHWNIYMGDARNIMQEELKKKSQFLKSLIEINAVFGDNQEFVNQVKKELFSDKVYVYTPIGDIIELPKGATAIDFAYKIGSSVGNTMAKVIVNDESVPFNYELKNKDRVRIITDKTLEPQEAWIDIAHTTYAKRKIKEFHNQ